ncbi:type III secretion system translocon subunit SctB [Halochromatium roseum]|uniref:type III secretion system translocon subunit SctB n=1 Tax=Halochromatium roseum TaxID=391920 RepID=UPI001912AEBE|nr:type III secretion system translocon subunit SctB [Halochromatium roseum]MBK5941109.1 hypothetical protein [Halochromatium roseum]
MSNTIDGQAGFIPASMPETSAFAVETDAADAARAASGLNATPTRIERMATDAVSSGQAAAPELPPPGEPDRQAMQGAADRVRHLSEEGMLDVFEVMAEFYKLTQTMRESSKQAAHAEMERQVAEIHLQADEMHNAAVNNLVAGIVSGAMQMAAGAMQFAGGVKSLKLTGGEQSIKLAETQANAMMMAFRGAAEGLSGMGKGIETNFQYAAAANQVAVKDHEAEATRAAGERDEMMQFKNKMEENMRATLDALRQVIQSREQMISKIFA